MGSVMVGGRVLRWDLTPAVLGTPTLEHLPNLLVVRKLLSVFLGATLHGVQNLLDQGCEPATPALETQH